jgi:hypothetical protein
MAGQKREARLRVRCPGHPRLLLLLKFPKDVDARDKPGHDGDFDINHSTLTEAS